MDSVVGVDTNPDGLGVADVDCLGQFRGSYYLHQNEWTYARSNRLGSRCCAGNYGMV